MECLINITMSLVNSNYYVTTCQMTDEHLRTELSGSAVTLTQLAECFNTSSVMSHK